MSTHKHIDKICCIVLALAIILTILFMNGEAIGLSAAENTMGYEERLFNSQAVHTIDIFMDDWDEFVEGCESEEYENCSVVIDNEVYKNVGIRAKGNTSLSQVSSSDSDRYSFKVEFDHYDSTKSYYGLDKLSLNNIIQDNTFMKDYIAYTMMAEYGVDAPLCSFVYITVNGEDWGLYLAVEAVEDSFLQRNYGGEYGELYKPDSMSNGGGRGNGKNFDFSDVEEQIDAENEQSGEQIEEPQKSMNSFDPSQFDQGMVPSEVMPSAPDGFDDAKGQANTVKNDGSMIQGGFGGGMGSNDVKLQYIDDNAESYSDIFDNAKTDITDADKERLISALKNLSENTDIESTVCVD